MHTTHTLANEIDRISVSHLAFHHKNIAHEYIKTQQRHVDDSERLLCEALYHLSCLAYQARTQPNIASVLVVDWAVMPCQSRQMLCWLNQLRSAIRHINHCVTTTTNNHPTRTIAR